MRISFKRIEIHNFMSFEDETFDFSDHRGMILVQGVNHDFPGQKNGSGKCLDKDTKIDIELDDDLYKEYIKMFPNSIISK